MSRLFYVYKINFVDGFFYYGKRILKGNNPLLDGYYGTPITHKEKWKTTMFWKEIIEVFDDWEKCSIKENELIFPNLQNNLCLNENCGGYISLDALKRGGSIGGKLQPKEVKKRNGKKSRDEKLGMFALSIEERKEIARKCGMKAFESKSGIHLQTIEDKVKLGEYCRDNKLGIHAMSFEERSKHSKKLYAEKKGLGGMTFEQKSMASKKAAAIRNSQKWQCTITGHISNPTGLSKYQNRRNINTKNRVRIK